MDRTYWCEVGQFLPGEKVVSQQTEVRLYDGEDRVSKGEATSYPYIKISHPVICTCIDNIAKGTLAILSMVHASQECSFPSDKL